MVYDVDTKQLIIAGANPEDGLSNVVLRLPALTKDAVWEELEILPRPVINPMVVNDDKYVYVLGGINSTKCVKLCKKPTDEDEKEWVPLKDLPDEGVSLADEYNGNCYSGALVSNDEILVFTRTKVLTLTEDPNEDTKTNWKPKLYGTDPKPKSKKPKGNIKHLTPILFGDEIAACIQWEHTEGQETIRKKTLDIFAKGLEVNWYWKHIKSVPKNAHIGAGRFLCANLKFDV